MTGRDDIPLARHLAALAEAGEARSFDEPWHAQAFAMTMHLAQRGVFDWDEWVGAFIPEVHEQPQREDEEVNAAYFRQWLAALEKLLAARGLCSPASVHDYAETWRRAYLNTAHGSPVEFIAGKRPVDDAHEHTHFHDPRPRERAPIAVSPRSPPGSR